MKELKKALTFDDILLVPAHSEVLPKQAKPAFFVLAPCGSNPFSKTIIFDFGKRSFKRIAQFKPTIPLPTTIKSLLVNHSLYSQ